MSDYYQNLSKQVEERFRGVVSCRVAYGELTVEVPGEELISVCAALRDEEQFSFEELIDLCGVDYSAYGENEWQGERFAVVYHLLSIKHNHRIRVRSFASGEMPVIDSVVPLWNGANWFEREAFDMFGIVFEGHPDLRRILTDYGFIGHPFRKDFPMTGNVEMRYDPEKGRVIYEPVTIEPRAQVPSVIRHDHRYIEPDTEGEG